MLLICFFALLWRGEGYGICDGLGLGLGLGLDCWVYYDRENGLAWNWR